MSQLRVAVIGHRFMGRAHSSAWRQVGRFFPVSRQPVLQVLCGRDRAETERAAATLGFAEAATSWEEVVRRPDVDVVDVCTPVALHRPMAVAAAAAGKAVLCEKPLARDVAEAEEMLAAVRAAGVPHMLCHNYRRVPAVALAKRLLADGRLGRIHHFRGVYLNDRLVDPQAPRTWRHDRAQAGGGTITDLGSHMIDLGRHLLGEIAEVTAQLTTFVSERPLPGGGGTAPVDVDDATVALLRFEGGVLGTLELSRFATGHRNYNRFEINGSAGSLAFNLERLNELELYDRADGSLGGFRTILVTERDHPYLSAWWPSGHVLGWEHTFVHTVYDFIEAIAAGKPVAPDFEDGLRAQRVIAAAQRSAVSRRWELVAAPTSTDI
jgi:predicted dehydrogenase